MERIDLLDHGYVAITEPVTGSDLTIVNSARVSYDKRSETIDKRDAGLINFLAKHGHTSPFRHATIQFEVYAPLMIARQWWKYVAGSDHTMDAWNESSRRYITEEAVFYVPNEDEWRGAPESSKQGSGEPLPVQVGANLTHMFMNHARDSEMLYERAMESGVCAEQARLFLPAYSLYVRWVWLGSVQSIAHLINQRTKDDAQHEFRVYAEAVKELADKHFPLSIKALTEAK